MARTNHTRFVLLGFLAHKPCSGYDIRKAIAASLGNFWNESFGQIYPALRDLEAEGWVRRTEGEADRHARRQTYTLTGTGHAALMAWLREPAAPHIYRVETLVKLFFAPLAGPWEAREHVRRFLAEHRALVAKYRAIGARLDRELPDQPGLPYWKLTVECGIAVGQAYVDWCERADAVLAGLAQGGSHA